MGWSFYLVRCRTRTHLNAARMSAAGDGSTSPLLNVVESYIVHLSLLPILKVNHQSSGLPFDFKGLSHGLKSVHRTLFTSLRSADLFAAYCIGSETHLNAAVRRTVAATSSKTGGFLLISTPPGVVFFFTDNQISSPNIKHLHIYTDTDIINLQFIAVACVDDFLQQRRQLKRSY